MLTVNGEKFLVEKEVSSKHGLSTHWLRKARYEKKGPKFHKLNGKIYYKENDVEEWFQNNLIKM